MEKETIFKAIHPATQEIEEIESICFRTSIVRFYDGDGFPIDQVPFIGNDGKTIVGIGDVKQSDIEWAKEIIEERSNSPKT